jgi:acyl-coenzyme A synthetase/AMP-(fatty) acid ligase
MKAAERDYAKVVKEGKISPWYIFDESAHKHWNSRAIWWRERTWTFGEMYDQTVRYAQWLLDEGVRPGELVAFYLTNTPDFMMLWFATLCIGAAPAFLNYNLEGNALLHCLKVCETRLVIADVDEACAARIEGSRSGIEATGAKIVYLDNALKASVSARHAVCPGDDYRKDVQGSFPYTLIYTR